MGTAYRTNARLPQCSNVDYVYAVWPPARFGQDQEATHLFVSSASAVGDTIAMPCTKDGKVLSFQLLACVQVLNHRKALEAAGYELEVFAYVRA